MPNGSRGAMLAGALLLALGTAPPASANPAAAHRNTQLLTGRIFSGHSGFPRGFGYTHTLTRAGQGSLRTYAPCVANPKPRRCR